MGAFDRLSTYKANEGYRKSMGVSSPKIDGENIEIVNKDEKDLVSQCFDTTQPLGYFLRVLHSMGYKIVEKDGETVKLTEFAQMLLSEGDTLALSSAGSGKTTSLTFKIMKDILTGEATKSVSIPNGQSINVVDSMFVGTFLKSGAEELKKSVEYWQRKLGYVITADNIHFGTLHAEFKRALNAMGVATPIAKQSELSKYLHKAIDSLGITREGKNLGFDDYITIESILAYYRNRLDKQRYNHPACDDYGITPVILDTLYKSYQDIKLKANVMDFEDLQELLYQYLYVTPNPAVQDFIANRYKYIYLDEFQDVSQIQYAILKFYARGRLAVNQDESLDTSTTFAGLIKRGVSPTEKGKIVCIGDDDQAIYSWRGSDVNIITHNFIEDFKPNIVTLSINYRCPANVLVPVISSITKNEMRYDKPLRSYAEGGIFYAKEFLNLVAMGNYLADEVTKDINEGMDVAIICRTNFDGLIPAFILEASKKFSFSISSEAMSLSSSLAKSAIEVANLFTERVSPAVKRVLTSLVPFYSRYEVDSLIKTLKNDNNVVKHASIWTLPIRDLEYSCGSLVGLIKGLRAYMFDCTGKKIQGGDVLALKMLYCYMIENVYDRDNTYCEKMRGFMKALVTLIEISDFSSVSDFVMEIEDLTDRLSARVKKEKQPISIVTVHEFKGKERDSTYVWNDSIKVFPANKTDLSNKDQLEEERRVHYIACTRAKKKNVILTLVGRHGMFLNEMDTTVGQVGFSGTISGNISELDEIKSNSDLVKDFSSENDDIKSKLENAEFDDSIPDL